MFKIQKRKFIIALIVVFAMGVGACVGFQALVFGQIQGYSWVNDQEYSEAKDFVSKYKTLYEIDKQVSTNFLWDYDRDAIQEKLYKTMVDSLGDKFSTYMNKDEYNQWNTNMSGKISGVGLVFQKDDDSFKVIQVIEDSPAEKAGFKEGDVIKEVNGKTYSELESMRDAIRGEKGTRVEITYERNGEATTKELIREDIELKSVASKVLDNNIGYIQISEFAENTGEQFKNELKDLENKKVDGIVIDLRENGGGYVTESLKVADELLPSCNLMSLVDKDGVSEKFNSDASCTSLKYAVLVDGNTASASEILAGAIQDNKGGPIVGTQTYGKGIVQTTYNLPNGGGLKLTTMEYLTPNGNHVHGKGITPDYKVELKEGDKTDYQLNKALELLKK